MPQQQEAAAPTSTATMAPPNLSETLRSRSYRKRSSSKLQRAQSSANAAADDDNAAAPGGAAAPAHGGAAALRSRPLLQRSASDGPPCAAAMARSSSVSWQRTPPVGVDGMGIDRGHAAEPAHRPPPNREPRRRRGSSDEKTPSPPALQASTRASLTPGDGLASLARVRSFRKPPPSCPPTPPTPQGHADGALGAPTGGGRPSLARVRSFRKPPPSTSIDGPGLTAAPQVHAEDAGPLAVGRAGNRLSLPAALERTPSKDRLLRTRSHVSSRLQRTRSGGGFEGGTSSGPGNTKRLSRSISDNGAANSMLHAAYDRHCFPEQAGAPAHSPPPVHPHPPSRRTLTSSTSE